MRSQHNMTPMLICATKVVYLVGLRFQPFIIDLTRYTACVPTPVSLTVLKGSSQERLVS
jgi:hypothetical protein